jgi:hypothetical protein
MHPVLFNIRFCEICGTDELCVAELYAILSRRFECDPVCLDYQRAGISQQQMSLLGTTGTVATGNDG